MPTGDAFREGKATFLAYLGRGHFLETACAAAGWRVSTVRRWLREGRKPGSEHEAFAAETARVMAESEDSVLKMLGEQVLAGDTKVATWWLERRYPLRWSPKVADLVDRERERMIDRVEALDAELGADVVERVLAALAGEDSSETPASTATVAH